MSHVDADTESTWAERRRAIKAVAVGVDVSGQFRVCRPLVGLIDTSELAWNGDEDSPIAVWACRVDDVAALRRYLAVDSTEETGCEPFLSPYCADVQKYAGTLSLESLLASAPDLLQSCGPVVRGWVNPHVSPAAGPSVFVQMRGGRTGAAKWDIEDVREGDYILVDMEGNDAEARDVNIPYDRAERPIPYEYHLTSEHDGRSWTHWVMLHSPAGTFFLPWYEGGYSYIMPVMLGLPWQGPCRVRALNPDNMPALISHLAIQDLHVRLCSERLESMLRDERRRCVEKFELFREAAIASTSDEEIRHYAFLHLGLDLGVRPRGIDAHLHIYSGDAI
jgi:hypothetical protein